MKMLLTDKGFVEAPWTKLNDFLDGLSQVPHTRTQFYDLCGWIFQHLSDTITSYPIALVQDPQTLKLTLIFSGVSAGIVALFSIGEGLKGVLGIQYTKFSTFIGRTVIAFIGAAMTLPALIFMMKSLALVCQWLLAIGHSSISGTVLFTSALSEIVNDGSVNFIVAVFFMIAFCVFALKAMFDTGVRWFDMVCNAIVSPVAWCCLVTDATKSFFDRWLASTTGLLLTNLVYAFYLSVICAITLAPWQMNTMGMFGRLILIVGAFWRLVKPPAWVQGITGEGQGAGAASSLIKLLLLRGIKLPKLK